MRMRTKCIKGFSSRDDKIVELGSDDENDNEVSFAPVGGHLTCFAHLILLVALS